MAKNNKSPKQKLTGAVPGAKEDLSQYAGKLIAWSRDRQRILAVGDSIADVIAQAEAGGEPEPYVNRAPGFSPEVLNRPFELLEHESPNILDDIEKWIPNHKVWLDTPNIDLMLQKPRDLIGTESL